MKLILHLNSPQTPFDSAFWNSLTQATKIVACPKVKFVAQVGHETFSLPLSRTQHGGNHRDKASTLRHSKGLQPPEYEEPNTGTGVDVAVEGMGSRGGGILPHATSQASSASQGAQGAACELT